MSLFGVVAVPVITAIGSDDICMVMLDNGPISLEDPTYLD